MRRLLAVLLLVCGTGACGGGSSDANGVTTRRVLVDYSFDEFPTSYFGYFPRIVEAHPGDTIEFRQSWTGEPHSVTLGTLAQPLGAPMRKAFVDEGPLPLDLDPTAQGLPSVFSDQANDFSVNQVAVRPCFIATAPVPTNPADCPQHQPRFDGTAAFYNSGYIPYRGITGNVFRVPLAKTIKPGSYFYYCVLHGPAMGGFIDVKAPRAKLNDHPADARDPALTKATNSLRAARSKARTASYRLPATDIQAGAFTQSVNGHVSYPATVNEFLPQTFHATVGQKVTWSLQDGPAHTVSFDVPPYLPAIRFGKDEVSLEPRVMLPAASPAYAATPPAEGYFTVDAGDYDGSHFLSTGFPPDGPLRYSVTFTKPGTYPYACLIHPRMIGKVVVRS
jgi:plastocyanin